MTILRIRSRGPLCWALAATLATSSVLLWSGACGSDTGQASFRQFPKLTGGGTAPIPQMSGPRTAGSVGIAPSGAAGTLGPRGAGGTVSAAPVGPVAVAGSAAAAGAGAIPGPAVAWCDVAPVLQSNCQSCHAAQPL